MGVAKAAGEQWKALSAAAKKPLRQSTRQSRPNTRRQWRSTRQRSQMPRRGKKTKKRKKTRRKKLQRRHRKRLNSELEYDTIIAESAHGKHAGMGWSAFSTTIESLCAGSWGRRGGSSDSGC